MTDEIKSVDTDEEEIKRDSKGRVKKGYSLNAKGRPKGTTSKLNENRLTNLLNKHGVEALTEIMRLAQIEAAKGNSATAIKAYAVVFDKYVQSVHKQQAADLKAATAKLVDDSEEDDSPDIQPVEFKMSVNA